MGSKQGYACEEKGLIKVLSDISLLSTDHAIFPQAVFLREQGLFRSQDIVGFLVSSLEVRLRA